MSTARDVFLSLSDSLLKRLRPALSTDKVRRDALVNDTKDLVNQTGEKIRTSAQKTANATAAL